jgi:enterochelin esterase-like enzyme
MNDKYVTMLIDEIIPQLKKQYNILNDPKMHAIAGLSSGAICAFTAAWQRPDYFHKVLSHYGSYTDIRGGHNYPFIIRKTKKKDIKIFMQDGNNDLNNEFGDWWLANLQMESAFKFKNYEFKFEKGSGTHNGKHAGSILPESLIWLWSDVIKN